MTGGRTPREKRVQVRMVSHEKELLAFHRRNPKRPPDGSFMLDAYRMGYRAALREIKRREKEGQS